MPLSPLGVWPVSDGAEAALARRAVDEHHQRLVARRRPAVGALALSASTSPPTLRIQARSPSFLRDALARCALTAA